MPGVVVRRVNNKSVMDWMEENRSSIARIKARVEIKDGLTNQQEFSQIELE